MIVYRDVASASKDEILSDNYDLVEVDDVVYEVQAKMVTIKEGDGGGGGGEISAIPEAEEEDAEDLDSSRTVNNVVHSLHLQETSFDKKSYMTYIKDYMKSVTDYLKEKKPERAEPFQKAAQDYVKKVLGNFSDYQFFIGENMDPEGMVVLCIWRDEQPVMIYFKDGLEGTKV